MNLTDFVGVHKRSPLSPPPWPPIAVKMGATEFQFGLLFALCRAINLMLCNELMPLQWCIGWTCHDTARLQNESMNAVLTSPALRQAVHCMTFSLSAYMCVYGM